jgi:hypothetical protein
MGARKPGPICVTNAEHIDDGTLCRQRSQPPGPVGINPAGSSENLYKVAFSALWNAYPNSKPYVDKKTGDPPQGFENQCAIKVSVALHGAGVEMKSFRGAHVLIDGKYAATGATDLASWLKSQRIPGISSPAVNVTGEDWQEKIKGKTGIVYFADYWARPGETKNRSGDHIDLWNGGRLTASGLEGAAVTFLRFGLGVNSGPGFSDLGKAATILFWEVR